MTDELRELLLGQGACLVGYADLHEVPSEARKGLPRGVAIAAPLNPRIVDKIAAGPTKEYHGEYVRVNRLLGQLAEAGARFLQSRGHRAIAASATTANFNCDTLWTNLPHKTVATRAGLGWIGKCALLVTEQFGSAVRFTSVLTDAPLTLGQPINESRCGDCTACVESCPAQAPSGKQWQLGASRADFFNAFSCHATASEVSGKLGIKDPICGICVAVCPRTQAYLKS